MNVGHERGMYIRKLLFGANLSKQSHVYVRLMLTFVLRQSLVEAVLAGTGRRLDHRRFFPGAPFRSLYLVSALAGSRHSIKHRGASC